MIHARFTKPLRWAVAGIVLMAGMASSAEEPPVLSLSQAIQIALDNNRPVAIAKLDILKSQWQVAQTKSKRFPEINTYLFASGNITSPTFNFPAGILETIGGTPNPSKNVNVPLSKGITGIASVQVAQPLSQLYQIHLAVRLQAVVHRSLPATIQRQKAVAWWRM